MIIRAVVIAVAVLAAFGGATADSEFPGGNGGSSSNAVPRTSVEVRPTPKR